MKGKREMGGGREGRRSRKLVSEKGVREEKVGD